MVLLGTLTLGDKTYALNDSKEFMNLKDKLLPNGYYGGRVDKLSKTGTIGVYMCMEGMEPIDLIVDTKEATKQVLTDVLTLKGIEHNPRATRDSLAKLLK